MVKWFVVDVLKGEVEYNIALIGNAWNGVYLHLNTPEKIAKYADERIAAIAEAKRIGYLLGLDTQEWGMPELEQVYFRHYGS